MPQTTQRPSRIPFQPKGHSTQGALSCPLLRHPLGHASQNQAALPLNGRPVKEQLSQLWWFSRNFCLSALNCPGIHAEQFDDPVTPIEYPCGQILQPERLGTSAYIPFKQSLQDDSVAVPIKYEAFPTLQF